jgi:NAD(P)-dependent dehydrogenase (short-subunit alcohol dehydrogenase family)
MDLQELMSLYDFSGRAFVITGGAGTLGGEIACALVGCGADVAILDRSPELAERLIHRIERMDRPGIGRAAIVYGDVLDPDKLREARDVILAEFGGLYGLINAAGGNRAQATASAVQPFFGLSDEALRSVFDLNMMGTVLPSQVFGEAMCRAGEGVILNFSSMSALRPLTRVPAYSAAKAGVSNFTEWLAVHMAQEYSSHPPMPLRRASFLRTRTASADRREDRRIDLSRRCDHRAHADGAFRCPEIFWAPHCGCCHRRPLYRHCSAN